MNIAKMRRHVAGAAERRKQEEADARAYFEAHIAAGVMPHIRVLPPSVPHFRPFRDRLPRIKAVPDPSAWPRPFRPVP